MQGRWPRAAMVGVVFTWIAGCGGDDSVVTDNGVSNRGNRRGSAAPSVPGGRPKERVKPKIERPVPPQDSAVANADPGDVFTLAPGEAEFAIVTDGANTFLATPPATGVDSTQFTIIPPSADKPTAAPPAGQFRFPDGFSVVEEAGFSDKGFPNRIRCDTDGSLMALIPSSISTQGTNDGPSNAAPQIAVFLDPYYIDVAEITLAQFNEFREWWRESKKRTLDRPVNANAPDDHPALGITWANARNYSLWANKQLPTECEWEKAARGPKGFLHPWGNGRAGWSPARKRDQIDAVMSFRADLSPYGVFDMAGNAREWCDDFYADTSYVEATRNGETVVRNWKGPKRGRVESHRVVKGNGPDWMAWHRSSANMRESGPNIGFRCVLRGFANEQDDPNSAPQSRSGTGF